ncbi:MAG: 3-deoxy-7-phosphoheptulonate synthase [Burkholderia contaminans]|uniref:Phospho-2-dehydro-3-deoxyheptonate aldolase n=1 Tax=Burkholderia contaminans TaxID=488447 RepID=A0AAP4QYB5_9BURK|nr:MULTISPECIES: 3-deoxy-7-phosphoheptulonate synthase [Burkholderia]MBD1415798.1 3-deoxy-7-phosphoheptulonate synthase [Burkholderia contaminans]MBH9667694.1 3-deoxy-7-phosphoheptulonate synthase [Burkholderia contaminans]MBH9675056.1 3-deoxy-7-phosphoheptulonate synthase [Burkholderia contaminans]MBH9704940.1 3-deoxy-7-phosphoheptulonate synthase [Burkholderia contaminans]MBH9722155.1 3-deoxy-7-phosphoheptulonate synthase [Burkholderia contaminans]
MHANTWTTHRDAVLHLPSPADLAGALPPALRATRTVHQARHAIVDVLNGTDDRLVVIAGPCSVHDPAAARDYAARLALQRARFADELEIVMRVYFEKPRTTVGWKGLINDPLLDGSERIDAGLHTARALLCDINGAEMPAATEFLDPLSPRYLADLVAWGAIGARTVESQVHRELASSLPIPIGFKNGTDGNVQVAVDAMCAAARAHRFLSVDAGGRLCATASPGNPHTHVVLRGGREPNFDAAAVNAVCERMVAAQCAPRVMIDVSHGNSRRQFRNQLGVGTAVAAQVAAGDARIVGVLIESNLIEGRQDLVPGVPLRYGQSITDACLSFADTTPLLETLAYAVRARRRGHAPAPDLDFAREPLLACCA